MNGPPMDERPGDSAGLAQLRARLAHAARHVPDALAGALAAEPARSDLAAVLAQAGPPIAIEVLAELSPLPAQERHQVLTGLLAAGSSGSAAALRAGLAAATRQALLSRIFSPSRLQALARACRTLTKETPRCVKP